MSEGRTAIVTDTTAYLPAELVEAHGIRLVSLYVAIAGEELARESEIGDYNDFYRRLADSGGSVTTSQPSLGDFIEVYEPLLSDGREIVSVHISSGISGTVGAANQAKKRLADDGKGGERIHVFDSRSSAGGLAMLALAGAAAAASGADGDATLARIAHTRENLKMWFSVDTLEYLRRGGRIGPARAFLGSALKIKPILTLEEEITPIERVRTSSRAFDRMVDHARERRADGADGWVVQHIQYPEVAERLVAECREIFGNEPVLTSEVGPVLGAHAGPGMLGVGSVPLSALS